MNAILTRILDACPAEAIPAGLLLDRLCDVWAGRGAALPKSVLTPGGHPFELTFRSDCDDISYTVEPGSPDATAAEKWQFVRAVTAQFDAMPTTLLRTLIAQTGQRFGCWLGVRRDAFKVYQEVVPAARELVRDALRQDVAGADGVTPTLAGITSMDGDIAEYYCVIDRPSQNALHRLFAAAMMAKHVPVILDYLGWLARSEVRVLWNRLHFGVSFRLSRSAPPALTLFVHGSELFANDGVARVRIGELARQLGFAMPLYFRGTQRAGDGMSHGMIGLRITPAGQLACSVGLRPIP